MSRYISLVLLTGFVLVCTQCRAGDPIVRTVTVLFDEASAVIDWALVDGDQLWVAKNEVHKTNGFEPKPEGFCSDEICVPIPQSTDWRVQHDDEEYFNVTRFAAKVDQVVAVAESRAIWSLGAVPIVQSEILPSGIAPDFELPDRDGNVVRLSGFRGKKVLLLTWSSW